MKYENHNKNSQAVDIAKLICAYFVLGIHTVFLEDIAPELRFWVQRLFWSLAVPFFFMCSGVYYKTDENESAFKLPRQVKRLVVPYFFWSIVYNIVIRNFDFKSILKGYLIASPGGAMWFVGALMISMVICKFIKTKKQHVVAIVVGLILYLFGISLNSYSGFLTRTQIGDVLVKYYKNTFDSTRNFVFTGFPMFILGYYIGRYGIPKFFSKKNCVLTSLFGWFLLLFLSLILRRKPDAFSGGYLYLIALPLIVFSVLCFLLQTENKFKFDTKILRKISTGIYFSHTPILVCISYLSGILYHFNLIENTFNTVIQFVMLSLITTVFSVIVIKLDNKFMNKLF